LTDFQIWCPFPYNSLAVRFTSSILTIQLAFTLRYYQLLRTPAITHVIHLLNTCSFIFLHPFSPLMVPCSKVDIPTSLHKISKLEYAMKSTLTFSTKEKNYTFSLTRIYRLANASLTKTIFKSKPLQICRTHLSSEYNTNKLIPKQEKCKKGKLHLTFLNFYYICNYLLKLKKPQFSVSIFQFHTSIKIFC
jgi:hypothetical protein